MIQARETQPLARCVKHKQSSYQKKSFQVQRCLYLCWEFPLHHSHNVWFADPPTWDGEEWCTGGAADRKHPGITNCMGERAGWCVSTLFIKCKVWDFNHYPVQSCMAVLIFHSRCIRHHHVQTRGCEGTALCLKLKVGSKPNIPYVASQSCFSTWSF